MGYFNTIIETITLDLYSEEIDQDFLIDINVRFLPEEPKSYWDPGSDEEIEIIDIDNIDYPVEISYNEIWGLIWEYYDNNYEELREQILSKFRQYEDDRADYLYGQSKYNF